MLKLKNKTMPDTSEIHNFIYKAGLYILGIVLGVAAKLAILNKEKPLTIKDFILHGVIAFACAWLVWALLEHYGRLDLANIASVIVGRYADYILVAIWKAVRNAINSNNLPKF